MPTLDRLPAAASALTGAEAWAAAASVARLSAVTAVISGGLAVEQDCEGFRV